MLALPATAQNTYNTYRNARFGTVVQYPSNLLIPQRESDSGDGRRFISRDGDVELSVYGFHNKNNRTVNREMLRAINDWRRDGARLTYWKWQGGWFVLSGYVGSDIFYEKTLYRNGVFHTLIWQYPKQMRKALDAPVTRSVRSFTAGRGFDQPASRPATRTSAAPAAVTSPKVSVAVVPAPAPATRQATTATRKKVGY